MTTGTAIVALMASLGWLFLNARALQAHGLSWRDKVSMAVAWAVLFAAVAVLFARIQE